jgi:hypothetical protein
MSGSPGKTDDSESDPTMDNEVLRCVRKVAMKKRQHRVKPGKIGERNPLECA